MRLVWNLVHVLSGGLLLALAWLLAALLVFPLATTRPLTAPCLRLSSLCLWPFGREAVRERQLVAYHGFVRTGRVEELGSRQGEPLAWGQLVLWLPLGAILICGHVLHGLLTSLPGLSCPWESRSFSLLRFAAFPSGCRVTGQDRARTIRYAGVPGPRPSSRAQVTEAAFEAACGQLARPTATLAAAALVLWASSSANEAFIYSGPPTVYFASFRAPDPLAVRPEPLPPLPIALPRMPDAPARPGCAAGQAPVFSAHLSRRSSGYALPLGSRKSTATLAAGGLRVLPHVKRVQAFAAANRHGKTRRIECLDAVVTRVSASRAHAAETALARRLASKLRPEVVVERSAYGRPRVVVRNGADLEPRHFAAVQRWIMSASTAKAPAEIRPATAVGWVANAAALPVRSGSAK